MCIFVVLCTCVSCFQKYTLNLNSNTICIFQVWHKCWWGWLIQAQVCFGDANKILFLTWSGAWGVPTCQQASWSSFHVKWWKLSWGICNFLWHGHLQCENVRDCVCCHGKATGIFFKNSTCWNRVKKNAFTDSDFLGHSWGSLLPRHCSSWWGHKTFKVELKTIFMRIIHFYFTIFILDKKFPVQLHFNFIHSSLMTLV